MIISQVLDLVKQYIIKGIIDLPSMANFQICKLYKVIAMLSYLGIIYSGVPQSIISPFSITKILSMSFNVDNRWAIHIIDNKEFMVEDI